MGKTINNLAAGLNAVTKEKLGLQHGIKSLENEIKISNLQQNRRSFVRATIRLKGTKDSFLQSNFNGTTKQSVFVNSVARLVGVKVEDVQINSVDDAVVAVASPDKSINRRRLLGNIRGFTPPQLQVASPPHVDVRLNIYSVNPEQISTILKSKFPLLASDYGFTGSALV